jgi:hypothetical protein
MPTVTMTDMSGQEEANKVKELVIYAMVAEGYLDEAKGAEFLSNYCVVLRDRSWFGRLIDKAFGEPAEGCMQYQVAKIVRYAGK